MLNTIIQFALKQRLLIVALAIGLIGYGSWQAAQMEIDVFPNLNRPRVTIMTEAPGLAPEEVETLITFPIESAVNGANGVQAVRSSSGVGISVVYVEFDWGTDIYTDRQIVAERMALVAERLPEGVKPTLAPISSIMGQIMMVGMWSESGETSPLEVRTLADWVVRQRLLTIPGVSQVFTMGGGRKQFQILVSPDEMLRFGVTLHDVKQAVSESNENATGGYLDDQGPNEFLVRALGRVQSVEDLEKLVVKVHEGRPIPLRRVARVVEAAQVKRGDSSAYARETDGSFSGGPAVVLTINKQPNADTRELSDAINKALVELQAGLPDDIRVESGLYSQKSFIDRSIDNVLEALRDGGILVVVILFLFLLNFRTTFITLTSIPVSLFITVIVFSAFGLSVNTMTLGGLAVAIGELMDDAIVDVENIFRRLKENRKAGSPKHPLLVVYQASTEIRNSIVFGTMIVVIGFIPLFALSGMEGRLFAPLGVAYIVSILSSLVVSLTLTPVLSYWLLPNAPVTSHEKDGLLLRLLKWMAGGVIRFSLRFSIPMVVAAGCVTALAMTFMLKLERDFLPPFNEGVAQLNVILPPGTSLQKSNDIARTVDERLMEIEDVSGFIRRTGRAELDEHAEGVNMSEMIITFDPDTTRTREEILDDIRESMADIPGIVTAVEQPLAHLIAHMLSGVKAQVGIKLYGDDLDVLRRTADQMQAAISNVDGVTDLQVEPQVIIPQYRIELDRDALLLYGLTPVQVSEFVETAMNGEVVSTVLTGQRTFDMLVRLDEPFREDLQALQRLSIELPGGGTAPLSAVAKIYESGGPNAVKREQVRRRIVLQCNVTGRGLVDVVQDIQKKLKPIQSDLADGYFIEYGGLFESQQAAARRITILFVLMLFGVFLVLYTMFRSANFSLQVMAALPMAFIGSVVALVIAGQTLTVAAMVGFISLGGIASRNGILLLNHYIHLVKYEGETWSKDMLVRAGQERLAPVLMTALTSGIGLIPLVLTAGEAGKEVLYPIAIVHIGGLTSCTLLEFLVRPALMWTFGRNAGERITSSVEDDIEFVDEKHEHKTAAEPVAA
ncbi:MAG: efflux RND transporter permease subunit [Planctomycetota bacterium]|jgi:HME family heavy-metal exporter